MRYEDAVRLTIPQLQHALGISNQTASSAEIAQMLMEKQREVFRKILDLRGWLPADLLRVPTEELARIVERLTGARPNALASAVMKYITLPQPWSEQWLPKQDH